MTTVLEIEILLAILLVLVLVVLCLVVVIGFEFRRLRTATETANKGLPPGQYEEARAQGLKQGLNARQDAMDLSEFIRANADAIGRAAGEVIGMEKGERKENERWRASGSNLPPEFQDTQVPPDKFVSRQHADKYDATIVMAAMKPKADK